MRAAPSIARSFAPLAAVASAVFVAGGGRSARAQLVPWSVDARLMGEIERDRPFLSPDGRRTTFESTERLVSSAGVEGERWLGRFVDVGGRLDTGDLEVTVDGFDVSGHSLAEEARDTAFVRELWLAFEAGEETTVRLEAGRRRLSLAPDLLLDDYALGASLEIDHDALALRAGAAVPGPDLVPDGPPVLYATLGYDFGFDGHVELLYARDTGAADEVRDEVARQVNLTALRNALERSRLARAAALRCLDPPPTTTAESVLHWLGGSLEYAFPGGQIEATWLTVVGRFDVEARLADPECVRLLAARGRPTARAFRTDVLGHALALDARFHVGGPWYPGFFAHWLSGNAGRPGEGGDYAGFLALAPFPRRPALFFDVGATSSLRSTRAATPGLGGRGVLALGPTLLYAPDEDLSFEATAAWLQADEENPATGARGYGPELDLRADWDVARTTRLFAEAAALPMGEFHPDRRTIWQVAAGCVVAVEGAPAR